MSRATRHRAAAAASLAVLGALLTAQVSWAEPDVGEDDVRDARAAVAQGAAAVAEIELALATGSAAVDAAWVAVSAAAEDYTAAVVARDEAAAAADVAQQRAEDALAEVEAARAELSDLAMEAYRSGGSLDELGAFLVADGWDDLVARSTAIDRIGEQAQRAVQRLEAAELVAGTLGERATQAVATAESTAAAAQEGLAAAQAAQVAAQDQVAAIAAERELLLAELAAARQTSVEVERARTAQLDADRRAREEAAAASNRGVSAPPTTSTPTTPPATSTPTTPPATSTPTTPPATSTPTTPPVTTTPTTPPTTPTPPPAASDQYGLGTGSQRGSADQGAAAVAWAVAQVGKPYSYGAAGPDAFDCSGLTSQAWKAAGLTINRTSRDQYRQVLKISYDSMRPGDLIFYGSVGSDPGSITHVAMYVGGGQMVEAPRPGVALRVTSIRWSGTMPFAGRP